VNARATWAVLGKLVVSGSDMISTVRGPQQQSAGGRQGCEGAVKPCWAGTGEVDVTSSPGTVPAPVEAGTLNEDQSP
jgi:hypothetical protein